MFENIRLLLPCLQPFSESDLERLEQRYHCRLPDDFRAFLTRFGAGTLNSREWINPLQGIEQPDPDDVQELMTSWDNTSEHFTEEEFSHLLFFGANGDGDAHVLLPGDAPRYLTLPHWFTIESSGYPTLEAFIDNDLKALSERFVENGIERQGSPETHTYIPNGYTWLRAPRMPWEMEPLFALFNSLARSDSSLLLTSDTYAGHQLVVPRYGAVMLASASGIDIQVILEHAVDCYQWLLNQATKHGFPAPAKLEAFFEEIKQEDGMRRYTHEHLLC